LKTVRKKDSNIDKKAHNRALKAKLAKNGKYTKEDEDLDLILNEDDYEFEE